MSVSIKRLTVEEFLAWERAQPHRYEFDGVQPVAMTGGSPLHALLIARVITVASNRVAPPCLVYASELKIITRERVRYPDVTIACGEADPTGDAVQPTIVFEVLSPSTALTDRRDKTLEYRGVGSIQAYVIVHHERPEVVVLRRSSGWVEEVLVGGEARLDLPEVGIQIPLSDFYPGR